MSVDDTYWRETMGFFDKIQGKNPKGGLLNRKKAPAEPAPAPRPVTQSAPADLSRTPADMPASSPAAESVRRYTVKSGDSLSKIAKQQYGDGNQWRRIYDANRDKIKDPDLIHPGQELTIPGS
jgi:nucleoid-associated protein YgaU